MLKKEFWLYSGFAFFAFPEIIWSPVSNFLYSFVMPTINGSSQVLRDNFLLSSDFEGLYIFVLLLQVVGAITLSITWALQHKRFKQRLLYWAVLIASIFISLLASLAGFLAVVLRNCCDIL